VEEHLQALERVDELEEDSAHGPPPQLETSEPRSDVSGTDRG
jgi:hypothetical protein